MTTSAMDPNNPEEQFKKVYNLTPVNSFMTNLIIKASGGLVTDQKQAQKVLLIVAGLIFFLAIYVAIIRPLLNRPDPKYMGIKSHVFITQ